MQSRFSNTDCGLADRIGRFNFVYSHIFLINPVSFVYTIHIFMLLLVSLLNFFIFAIMDQQMERQKNGHDFELGFNHVKI